MSEFQVIDHVDDARLAPFRLRERGLANREQKRADGGGGLFLAEGDLVVARALDAGCRPHAALADGERIPPVATRFRDAGGTVYVGGEQIRRLVTRLGMPQAIVALFHRPVRLGVDELVATADRLVVVEAVDNPSNIGAIVRNAAAMGWDGLLLDHTSADPLSRRALRVAMGTAFSLPHARTTRLVDVVAALAGRPGTTLYALTPDPSAADIRSVSPVGRRAVLIGSERAGLSDAMMSWATPVRIPMTAGVDSLNAAAATAIACYALG